MDKVYRVKDPQKSQKRIMGLLTEKQKDAIRESNKVLVKVSRKEITLRATYQQKVSPYAFDQVDSVM